METTCRACLNYTENGVRLLTLYKHYHYLPIIILNCTGIKVDDSEVDNKLPLCESCADKLVDINDFRTMYLESHNKLKVNFKECLKYSPLDNQNNMKKSNSNNHGAGPEIDSKDFENNKIKSEPSQQHHPQHVLYDNIIIDETQLIHSNHKENNIVDIAMSMASVPTGQLDIQMISNSGDVKNKRTTSARRTRKRAKNSTIENDPNMLDINNQNGLSSNSINDLQYIVLQSDTKIFACSNCEQQFISESFLKQHIQKAHPIEQIQQSMLPPLSAHLQQQQPQLIYLCHLCESKQFTSEIQLNHHMFIHSEIAAGTLTDDPFPYCSCEHCAVLTTNDKLIEFEQEVLSQMTDETTTMATIPTTSASTRAMPSAKSSTKSGPPYSCTVCNKSSFKTQHRLLKHMRIHSNEQPFACEICHKAYNASSSLKSHQRMVHNINNNNGNTVGTPTNQPSLICSICNKSFLKSCHLTVHMKTVHNNDRQYACQYCSYRFSMQSKLTTHIRQAHGNVESGTGTTTTTIITPDDDVLMTSSLTTASSMDQQQMQAITTTISDSVPE